MLYEIIGRALIFSSSIILLELVWCKTFVVGVRLTCQSPLDMSRNSSNTIIPCLPMHIVSSINRVLHMWLHRRPVDISSPYFRCREIWYLLAAFGRKGQSGRSLWVYLMVLPFGIQNLIPGCDTSILVQWILDIINVPFPPVS